MSEEDLQSKVRQYIQDAIQFIDDEISPIRAKATRQYLGEPYGNEVEGRSAVVSRDIRDSVAACLPSLMRVFFGSEKVCEFVADARASGEGGHAVVLSMAQLAGKTTAGLLAAVQGMLIRGETALFISASPKRSPG